MCLGAVLNAGIKTLVLGARNRDIQRLAKLASTSRITASNVSPKWWDGI